ncbi:MAG: hypothetical protein L3J63_04005 [Geopsychrobacter sp.]|nr:hypothetical protein [Geopsychrobacter sp.]
MKIVSLNLLLILLLLVGTSTASKSLDYYSDYFSFIGQDEQGFVIFALDNNRGGDEGDYRAEHFGILYDQHQGWIDLVGIGEYQNPLRILSTIPDSTAFKFSGHPNSGIRIQSRINDLRLEINPLKIQLEEITKNRNQKWGNAAAVLYWQGRTIPGRVIYEGLRQENWNHLTHRYSNDWDNLQGFYLALQNGHPDSWQDIFLRAEGKKQDLKTRGFVDTGQVQAEISAQDLKVNRKSWALGFYRWPKGWQMHLKPTPSATLQDPLSPLLRLNQVSRQNISNRLIGGFAMSVVSGTIEIDGRSSRVLGLVELIK